MSKLETTKIQQIDQQLATVMDPELNIDIVSLGLIYEIQVKPVQVKNGTIDQIYILMTLTTPGCPLGHVINEKIREAVSDLPWVTDADEQLNLELTFDPPWVPEMMTEEARAELGL